MSLGRVNSWISQTSQPGSSVKALTTFTSRLQGGARKANKEEFSLNE